MIVTDLMVPNGLFFACDYIIRSENTIYVTEAPYPQWSKSI